jgi:hypothetical protein
MGIIVTEKFKYCFPILFRHQDSWIAKDYKDLIGYHQKWGLNNRRHPELDIPSLTLEQATLFYYEKYWVPAYCEEMPYPMCLLQFVVAINHDVPYACRAYLAGKNIFAKYMFRMEDKTKPRKYDRKFKWVRVKRQKFKFFIKEIPKFIKQYKGEEYGMAS